MAKSELTTIPEYYKRYLDLIKEEELLDALKSSTEVWKKETRKIPKSKGEFRYAENKWTVKEVLQHVIDTDRVFAFRALCVARGERKDLVGFDENVYAENSYSNDRSLAELIQDFEIQRASTISMFSSFRPEALKRKGSANGLVVSAELLGFVPIGHQLHHLGIIRERYL